MKKKLLKNQMTRGLVSILVASMLCTSGCGLTANPIDETETTESAREEKLVHPKAVDDFYGYVNYDTLTTIDIRYGHREAGAFADVELAIENEIDLLIDEILAKDAKERNDYEQVLVQAYEHALASDNDAVDDKVKKQIESEIKAICEIPDLEAFLTTSVRMQRDYGITCPWLPIVYQNTLQHGEYAIMSWPQNQFGGVSLEDVNERTIDAKDAEDAINRSLRVAGWSKEEADSLAKDCAYLVIDLAWATNYELQHDVVQEKYMKLYSNTELDAMFNTVSSEHMEQLCGIEENPYGGWIVSDEKQLITLYNMLTEDNLEALKAILLNSFITSYGSMIADDHDELASYKDNRTAEESAKDFVKNYCTSVVDHLYIERFYSEEMDQGLRDMCDDIVAQYRININNAEWMSEVGRTRLLEKLDNIEFYTGTSEYHYDLQTTKDAFGADIFETVININRSIYDQMFANIGKPMIQEPQMLMTTVNACYTPDNTVTITAAIMHAPFYDQNASYAQNLGGLGSVIAHEIGHAFDSNCISWDMNGDYNPEWLPAEDLEVIEERNHKAKSYFVDNFTVFDVYHVDGNLTLGENYADLGGLEVVTKICTNQEELKLLFENYAKVWCTLECDSSVLDGLLYDPHSPAIIRVNAMVANLDCFYEVYGVKEGDGMYIAPEKRISRWGEM